ncbi:MAG TPA: helix-turn-helix domain-containing protein [Jiangellaceae bacterium]
MGTYGQFCPVAKALELLDERWTVLVIRELLSGSSHFNELRRGVPRMSPALLAKRLQRLMRAGVVERYADGNRVVYRLTPAGEELRPVVDAMGTWGVRWIPELGDEDLDPHLLMWDIHRNIDLEALPPGRSTLHFRFRGAPEHARQWWLVMSAAGVDVCDVDPGFPIVATVDAELRCLTRVWRGDIGWREAVFSGDLTVIGSTQIRRAIPRWLKLSAFAVVPRREPAAHPA